MAIRAPTRTRCGVSAAAAAVLEGRHPASRRDGRPAPSPRRARLAPFALLVLLVLAGCGGSDLPTEVVDPVVGTWTLHSLHGEPLPYVDDTNPAFRIEVLSGTLSFVSGGTYTYVVAYRVTSSGGVTAESHSDAGTYTRTDGLLTMRSSQPGAAPVTATLSGEGTLSFADGDEMLVFKRT